MGTGSPVGGHVNFEVEDVWGKKLFGKMTYFLLFVKSMCNKTHELLRCRCRNKKGDVGGAFELAYDWLFEGKEVQYTPENEHGA